MEEEDACPRARAAAAKGLMVEAEEEKTVPQRGEESSLFRLDTNCGGGGIMTEGSSDCAGAID